MSRKPSKRKMKPMFGAVDAGTKEPKYSSSETVKRFKAYVFAWRSGTAILADHGWKLGNETALEELSKAANHQVSVLDAFNNVCCGSAGLSLQTGFPCFHE